MAGEPVCEGGRGRSVGGALSISRRGFVAALGAAMGAAVVSTVARGQGRTYPSKPIRVIVPFASGGGSDTFMRLIAARLSESRRYVTVIENRPGAGGNLGAEIALREPADGYTLLVISGSYAGNAVVSKPGFDPINAIQPVIQFTREPMMVVGSANAAADTLARVIDKARAAPGTVTYGSSGVGGLIHLSTEYFASVAGIRMSHVPYKGTGAALNDLLGGQIELLFGGTSTLLQLAKAGKLRPLAVESPHRLAALPGMPTFAEAGVPGFDVDLWHGLVVARSTPHDIVATLNRDINAVLRSPAMGSRFAADDVEPAGGTPEAFGASIRKDMERWQMLVKAGKVKIDG